MVAGRIAVVGAGLAGLSAALDLKDRGFKVDLFERSRLLGGKVTSFTVGGVEIDNGQHVYLACCTEFIAFARRLGHRSSGDGGTLFLQDRFDALMLARDRPPARLRAVRLPAPFHLLPALLRYGYLTPLARLRIALAVLGAGNPAPPDETFAAWLERHHQGKEAREAFWEPFLVPALNAPLEEVAAEAALFVISTAFLKDAAAGRFGYARVPLARLAESSAAQLDQVYCRLPVTGVELERGEAADPVGVNLLVADGRNFSYDAVVLAVPPKNLARMLRRPEDFGLDDLESFRTAPIVDVHLWYDVARFGFGFAALIDSPLQWVFEKGPGYVCCSMSAANEYIGLPSSELVDLCHGELARILPMIRSMPRKAAVTRDREATFIPAPGLRRPGAATTSPRVAIAGAWTDTGWPATMESAVRSGHSAASHIAAGVSQAI